MTNYQLAFPVYNISSKNDLLHGNKQEIVFYI